MTLSDVLTLFAYDTWATERTLQSVSALPEPKYLENLRSSHGGIHTTLVHIYSASWLWLQRWNGHPPVAHVSPDEIPSLDSLKDRWRAYGVERDRFFKDLSEEKLAAPLSYSDLRGNRHAEPLVHQVQHVTNHASYHRGQVVTMIRQQGGTPVSTDLIAFFRETGPATT